MEARYLSAVVGVCLLACPAVAQPTHRNIFSGRQTYWVKGDSNVTVEEKDHRTTSEHSRSAPDAEYVKVSSQPKSGVTDAEYAHYVYETPAPPITDQLSASLCV